MLLTSERRAGGTEARQGVRRNRCREVGGRGERERKGERE